MDSVSNSRGYDIMANLERICANCSACRTSARGSYYCRRYDVVVMPNGACETIDAGVVKRKNL